MIRSVAVSLDSQTQQIVRQVEALGYRVIVNSVKHRTRMTAVAPDGDEEWGIAATPLEAATQLLHYVRQQRAGESEELY
jgi:hypothetical protein